MKSNFYIIFILFLVISACSDNSDTITDGDSDLDKETSSEVQESDTEETNEEQENDNEITAFSALECIQDPGCKKIMVVAHRGYTVVHPENSLASIRAAAELGVDFAEIDVKHTKDDKLILMHDSDIKRTVDGSGNVDELTIDELSKMSLKDCEAGNEESCKVPQFSEALKLAKSLNIMLYVDMKTHKWELTLQDIQSGDYYDIALVRDDAENLQKMIEQDNKLLVMPPVSNATELDDVIKMLPGLKIVEIAKPTANEELSKAITAKGLNIQQDVMVADILALDGNYTGWKSFVDAGVILLQTDIENLLVKAAKQYNETGVFPEEGEGAL